MKSRTIILVMALTMTCLSTSAQIMLTPMIDSSIGGVTANNRALIEASLWRAVYLGMQGCGIATRGVRK